MDIIKFLETTEAFINQQSDAIKEQSNILKNELNLISPEELKKTLTSLQNENRLLRVGIIGRVKAGKSSLLNSLLFDGESILPKAATPMTAALTIMEYSEDGKAKAEIDFFTENDLSIIKENAERYEMMREKIRQEKVIFFQNLPRQLSAEDIATRALKAADSEMKEHYTYASFDQYERMKDSGVNLSMLQQYKDIESDSVDDLIQNKLYDFVGAKGKFMPFTKSVKLYLPKDSLKGLEIIDTPGINDPVASRGARTEELLKTCDVVLIVSPSGQFLSNEDMGLMSRVTTKEGIQEAYIIASQADNQLFGNLKSDLPSETIQKITTTLNKHARNTLSAEAEKSPEMQAILEKFLSEDIICNSSVAFTLWKNFDNQDKWDDTANHLWKQLNQYYPNVFSNSDFAKQALLELANIKPIENIFDEVKGKKEEIVLAKSKSLSDAQYKTALEYIDSLETYLNEQIARIENSDLASSEKEKEKFSRAKSNLESEIQNTYSELVDDISLNLKSTLKKKVSNIFSQFDGDSAKSTEVETRQRWKEGFLGGLRRFFGGSGGKFVSYSVTVNYVSPTQIKSQINRILNRIEDQLEEDAQAYLIKWKRSFDNRFITIIQSISREEELLIDKKIANSAITSVKNAIPHFSFTLDKKLPASLNKSERLADSDGETYLSNAEAYMSQLENMARHRVTEFSDNTINSLKGIKAEEKLVNYIDNQVNQLVEDLTNAEEAILNYQSIKDYLKTLKKS